MSEQFEMEDEDRAEIVEEFLGEAEQYLQVLNENLLKAEELVKGGDEVPKDDMHAMFRAAHTIKGTASFLDFKTITHLTHEMETILDRVRNDEMVLTSDIIDVLFCAFDGLNGLLDRLRSEGNDDGDVSEASDKIQAVLSGEAVESTEDKSEESEDATSVEQEAQANEGSKSEEEAYMSAFIEDTEQNIERFNEILLAFEKEEFKPEHVGELFRVAHTIKGSAGIMKFSTIEMVSHKMEDILSQYREKEEKPDEDTISLLFKGLDKIKEIVDMLQKGENQEHDVTDLIAEFKSLQVNSNKQASEKVKTEASSTIVKIDLESLSEGEKQSLKNAIEAGMTAYRVNVEISELSATKSIKAMVIQEKISKLGTLIKASLQDSDIEDDFNINIAIQYFIATDKEEAEIQSTLNIDEVKILSLEKEETSPLTSTKAETKNEEPKKEEKASPAAKPKAAPAAKEAKAKSSAVEVTTMRIDARKLDNLMNLAGELVITRSRFSQLVNDLAEEVSKTKEMSHKFQGLEHSISSLKLDIKDKAEDSTQDIFENIGQDFNTMKDSLSMKGIHSKLYSLDEAMGNLEKLSSDIQNGVMATRMVQIEGVFTRFKRLVRDISKDVKKDVTLDIFGEDTELDKKIVDELGDPLTHMVRNAIDHGLETPKEREAAGKSKTGTVTLGASHRGNNIVIEIADDGKGLDADKIAEKGVEKGIISEEQSEQMTEREKLNLIFAPGFSTAAKVTGLSGRGVGMDVVKKMIESLNGTVDIESEMGVGTTFKMKIPLTLAIIQALLVVVNEDVFAIPLESVSEIIKIDSEEVYSIEGNETIKLRDHALSLIRLEKVIKIKSNEQDNKKHHQVVVVTDGETLVGIPVDRLIGEDEIVIKSLPEHFTNVIGISGASILGDGRISLIMDVGMIIRAAQ